MPPIPYKTPAWVDPNNASVTDSWFTWAARQVGRLVGADDPAGSVMGLAGAMEVPAAKAAKHIARLLVPDPDVLSAGFHATKAATPLERDALTKASYGVRVGRTSELDDLLTSDPVTSRALYERFAPAREALRAKYGDTVTLYRAQGPERAAGKKTLNFASKAGAEKFLEPGRSLIERKVNVDDILAVHNPTGAYEEYVVSLAGAPKAPIKAYHGSPHDFDQFSLSKIGTGEGGQAYGHGLYFAENEGVAKQYRDQLSAKTQFWGSRLDPDAFAARVSDLKYPDAVLDAAKAQLSAHKGDAISAIDTLDRQGRSEAANAVRVAMNKSKPGRMYEVNIHADPESFLDWDTPLSEQPKAQQQLRQEGIVKDYPVGPRLEHPVTGETVPLTIKGADAYEFLQKGGATKAGPTRAEVAAKLKEAGIPGIRYLDQGSRGIGSTRLGTSKNLVKQFGSDKAALAEAQKRLAAGDNPGLWRAVVDDLSTPETRNYVVFDESLISVARKYGIPLAVLSSPTGKKMLESLARRDQLAESPAQGQNRRTP